MRHLNCQKWFYASETSSPVKNLQKSGNEITTYKHSSLRFEPKKVDYFYKNNFVVALNILRSCKNKEGRSLFFQKTRDSWWKLASFLVCSTIHGILMPFATKWDNVTMSFFYRTFSNKNGLELSLRKSERSFFNLISLSSIDLLLQQGVRFDPDLP